jgi:hypothetical protein
MERVLGLQMGDFVRALQKSVVWFSIFKIPRNRSMADEQRSAFPSVFGMGYWPPPESAD